MFYPPLNASKMKRFSFKSGYVVWDDMRRQLQPNKAVLAFHIIAKDVLALHYYQDEAH